MGLRMTLRARVWGLGKVFLLAGALSSTYVVSALLGARMALRTTEVEVPVLLGLAPGEASEALTARGLVLRVDDKRLADGTVEAGAVAQQEPAPGSGARQHRTVRVWLSAGPRIHRIPELTGETERTARIRLAQEGLTLTSVSEVVADGDVDAVMAQTPSAESEADTVTLLVSRGRRVTFVMPDFSGTDGWSAAEALRARGLRVTTTSQHGYAAAATGVVVRQSPPSGYPVGPGDAIALEVAQ